ncbi:energy-coupling factor ABC transporter permease [Neisseria perflava]|uniref:energy-coupling factor ABC transporter permease n=1 Tax=Neisseria perflava TaxID=33053 RepID=UPI00209E1B09|nr:energy-coupling factor ABC transporter permease [Neisseria perflava]MCP1661225.1 putative membrane protein [Neisseria perflava]MCP1773277.1 putative membrane protein [Neisseria perflava]
MIFQTEWFSPFTLLAAALLTAVLLAATARRAWRAFARYKSAAALACVILATAWCLNATPDSGHLAGMNYHLLAVNLTALMIGAPAAWWLGVLLLFPYTVLFGGGWQAVPLNALALLLPALAVNLAARAWVNRLPANIFIFIFLNGFLASAAGMMVTGLVLVGVLDWANAFSDGVLWSTAFPVFFLISWAEAFLSGITTAIFVALRPQWLNTFDDGRYLKAENKIW